MFFRSPSAHLAIRATFLAAGAGLVVAATGANARWFEDHWLSSYCTRSAVTPALEATIRLIAAGSGVVIVALAGSRLTPWALRLDPGTLLRKSAVFTIAVTLSLVVSDALLRLRHGVRTPADDPTLPPTTIDAGGNLAPLASRTKEVTFGKRIVRYAFDAEGHRARSSDHVTDPNAPTIVFTGESVGMGWGVAYEDSYPALVAAALTIQSVNVAFAGFANDQAYLHARDELSKLSRPVAVVTVALSDQLERNVRPTRNHLVLTSDGRLELAVASTSLWATSPLRRLMGYHSAEAIPLTRAILQATAAVSRSRGAVPIFLWTNYGDPCDRGDRDTSALEERLFSGLGEAHVRVDITADQRIDGARDAHPNEKGHQALARAVLEALRGVSLSAR